MRVCVAAGAVLALCVGAWGCSNGSGNAGNPVSPTPAGGGGGGGVVTINVVAINGAQSFSPNPATLPAGQMVVWHNVDSVTHHVVLDDRSVDTGNIAPGASSQPMAIAAAGGPYHCTIHPEMVGSINQVLSSQPPPCDGPYCG